MRPRIAALAFAAFWAAGCAPKFKSGGSLTVDGAPFNPVTCSALAGAEGGVALTDATGTRLTLALPPAQLPYGVEYGGKPKARLEPAGGKPPIALGACGKLDLQGEAYHAGGKRAVSGHASLACSGGATVGGEIDFTGCF